MLYNTYKRKNKDGNAMSYNTFYYVDTLGTKLFTVVCLPNQTSKFPTVIFRSPYVEYAKTSSEDEAVARIAEMQKSFLENGYAVVYQHCRGCGKSDGDFIPYVSEREDGLTLHDWVRKQPFYNGELYLSAYAVPYFEDYEYGRGEIKEILEIVWDSFPDITDEMVLRLFKERYKAIMLICDKEDGTLKEFYSVNSGIGSNFKVINGELVWEVESFETMHYSIATSAFTFIGETQVYNYIYNNETELKEIVQTEEVRVFRK